MKIYKHNFFFPIWGDNYIKNFNNFALKCLIYNLETIKKPQLDKININIWTSKKDIKIFKNLKDIKYLNSLVNINYSTIDYLLYKFKNYQSKYLFLSNLQSLFLSESLLKEYNYCWFIYPDFIFSNSLIKNLINKINQNNYESVFIPVPQIIEEEFKSILQKNHISKIIPKIKFILQEHMHPIVSNCNINNLKTNTPSMFMTSKKDEFILFRYFHIHPIVVRLNSNANYIFNEMSSSLDQDLVKNFENKNIYQVSDDKIGICVSLLKRHEIKLYDTKFDLDNTCSWVIKNTNKSHHIYVKEEYLIKYKNFNLKSFNIKKHKLNLHIKKILKEISSKKFNIEQNLNKMKEAMINSYDNEILFLKRELHRRINFYKKINKYNKKTIKNFFNEQNNSETVNFLKNLYK
jgi:hypothetical protein